MDDEVDCAKGARTRVGDGGVTLTTSLGPVEPPWSVFELSASYSDPPSATSRIETSDCAPSTDGVQSEKREESPGGGQMSLKSDSVDSEDLFRSGATGGKGILASRLCDGTTGRDAVGEASAAKIESGQVSRLLLQRERRCRAMKARYKTTYRLSDQM